MRALRDVRVGAARVLVDQGFELSAHVLHELPAVYCVRVHDVCAQAFRGGVHQRDRALAARRFRLRERVARRREQCGERPIREEYSTKLKECRSIERHRPRNGRQQVSGNLLVHQAI